jgi:hypothetical protein
MDFWKIHATDPDTCNAKITGINNPETSGNLCENKARKASS